MKRARPVSNVRSKKIKNSIAIETSGSHLSWAIYRKGVLAAQFQADAKWNHEQVFWSRFPKDLKKTGLRIKDMDFLAATSGPGRFTGVRLGLAIVNTWSALHKIPVFAPTVPELMAWQGAGGQPLGAVPRVCPPQLLVCLVAFSGAYVMAHIKEGGIQSLKTYPSLDEALKTPRPLLYYVQENLKARVLALAKNSGYALVKEEIPQAQCLGQFALDAARKNKSWYNPPRLPQPLYLKESWK